MFASEACRAYRNAKAEEYCLELPPTSDAGECAIEPSPELRCQYIPVAIQICILIDYEFSVHEPLVFEFSPQAHLEGEDREFEFSNGFRYIFVSEQCYFALYQKLYVDYLMKSILGIRSRLI